MFSEGGFGDDDGIEGVGDEEEGGGWDVGDDDLELPADLVSTQRLYFHCSFNSHQKYCYFHKEIKEGGRRFTKLSSSVYKITPLLIMFMYCSST